MGEDLVTVVLDRASSDTSLTEDAKLLILAALEGDADLADALDTSRPTPAPSSADGPTGPPVRAFLSCVTVEGFRGIGPRASLALTPGPGLVVVAGRNGSGKSSFAEALEVALTRGSYRWQHRKQAVWRESWRNLHQGDPASITVELAEEGAGATTVGAQWAADAALDDAQTWVQRRGAKRERGLDGLCWARDLELFRPFLSYDELGALFAEPSKLYTALASILGLERLEDAQGRLTEVQKSLGAAKDAAAELGKQLRSELEALDDERAATALAQVRKYKPDLAAVTALVTGGASDDGGGPARLRRLAGLAAPDVETFVAASTRYQEAVGALATAEAAVGESNARKADLLSTALVVHEQEGDGPCPVCGQGHLDAEWVARVTAELARDHLATQARVDARRHVVTRSQELAATVVAVPAVLAETVEPGSMGEADVEVLGAAVAAWRAWTRLGGDPAALAGVPGREALDRVVAAVHTLTDHVSQELARREDAWQPVAVRLAEWLRHVQQSHAQAEQLALVKTAAAWLKGNANDLRNQRLRPLAERAKRIWALLRQESNVDLGDITLAGTSTRRRVELSAAVDGVAAGVLGVMSQGELHALALALFLPKATAEGSPFGFVVIDDPVQAMDPAKVDGLARVLENIAADRQVVVFTHDDRLPEAVRRLGISARLVEVTRDQDSLLAVSDSSDPAARYLDDARAVASDPAVPDDVRRRVIPELCRMSVEAACRDTYFGRQLRTGARRTDVEDAWTAANATRGKVALAVGVDPAAGGLDSWLARQPHRRIGLGICGPGVHNGLRGDSHTAIDHVTRLVADLGTIGVR